MKRKRNNEAGKMNGNSSDVTYMNLICELREKLRQLAEKLEPKVYEYEFLKGLKCLVFTNVS